MKRVLLVSAIILFSFGVTTFSLWKDEKRDERETGRLIPVLELAPDTVYFVIARSLTLPNGETGYIVSFKETETRGIRSKDSLPWVFRIVPDKKGERKIVDWRGKS